MYFNAQKKQVSKPFEDPIFVNENFHKLLFNVEMKSRK